MFYQKVRSILESNIRETLTQREDEIITRAAEECVSIHYKIIDDERLRQEIKLSVIRFIVETFKPVLYGRQKLLDTLVNIFINVRSVNYSIKNVLYQQNTANTEKENKEISIKKIKLVLQKALLTIVYFFTPGHSNEEDIEEYKKYREREVYGLDKEDGEVSNTFNDILDEL
jgi:hypothetical protein